MKTLVKMLYFIPLIVGCNSTIHKEQGREQKQEQQTLFTDINPNSDTYSQGYSLEEVIEGDNPVVVDFFEPWCGHCIEELPTLERLYQDRNAKFFGFTGDYFTFPETKDEERYQEWTPIEEIISFPFFDGAQQYDEQIRFLRAYTSDIVTDDAETSRYFLKTGYPTTIIFYADNKSVCVFNGKKEYTQLNEYISDKESCLRDSE